MKILLVLLFLLSLPAWAQTVVYRPTPIYWQAFGLAQTCVASGACPAWVDVDDDWRRVVVGQNTFACITDRADAKRRAVVGAPSVAVDQVLRDQPGVLLDLTNAQLRRPAPNEALRACFPDWPLPPVALGEPIYAQVIATADGRAVDWPATNARVSGTTTAGEVCGPKIAPPTSVPESDPAVAWYALRTGGTRCRQQ